MEKGLIDTGVFVIKFEKKSFICDAMCVFSLIVLLLPYSNALFGSLINWIKIVPNIVFLLGILVRDFALFRKAVLILTVAFIYNTLYYFQIAHVHSTFAGFIAKSILIWFFVIYGYYYAKYGNANTARKFINVVVFCSIFTCCTTIMALQNYPEAVRVLGNAAGAADVSDDVLYSYNVASWSLLYGFTFLLPFVIECFKKTRKFKFFICIIALILCIVLSQITFAVLFTLLFVLMSTLTNISFKKIIIATGIFFIVCLIFRSQIGDLLLGLSFFLDGSVIQKLSDRSNELYMSLVLLDFQGDALGRMVLYMTSLLTFLDEPFWGTPLETMGFTHIGMHSQVLDSLAGIGLVGCMPIAALVVYVYYDIKKCILENSVVNIFKISFLLYIILAILNPIWYAPEITLFIFFMPFIIRRCL